MCLVKYEDYEEIFFLPPDVAVAVAVLICLSSLITGRQGLFFRSDPTATPVPSARAARLRRAIGSDGKNSLQNL